MIPPPRPSHSSCYACPVPCHTCQDPVVDNFTFPGSVELCLCRSCNVCSDFAVKELKEGACPVGTEEEATSFLLSTSLSCSGQRAGGGKFFSEMLAKFSLTCFGCSEISRHFSHCWNHHSTPEQNPSKPAYCFCGMA